MELLGKGAGLEEIADILGNSPEIVRCNLIKINQNNKDLWCREGGRPPHEVALGGF
jgi:hypothetical protein